MDSALHPTTPASARGLAKFVAALSVGGRTSAPGVERGWIGRRGRRTAGRPGVPSGDGGPGQRDPAVATAGVVQVADRRRRVEAELIGLHGPEPDWWSACWRRGLADDPDPDHLFEVVAAPLPDVTVVHGLPVGGTEATVDHVLIGPGGVVVVDSVSCPGRVRSDGVHLRVRGKDRSTLVDVALWRAEVVRATLATHGLDGVPVHGVLHWRDAEGLGPRAICLRGIPLLTAGAATGLAANGLVVSPLVAGRVRTALAPHA